MNGDEETVRRHMSRPNESVGERAEILGIEGKSVKFERKTRGEGGCLDIN